MTFMNKYVLGDIRARLSADDIYYTANICWGRFGVLFVSWSRRLDKSARWQNIKLPEYTMFIASLRTVKKRRHNLDFIGGKWYAQNIFLLHTDKLLSMVGCWSKRKYRGKTCWLQICTELAFEMMTFMRNNLN